jgi:voltage-gated sodium channel
VKTSVVRLRDQFLALHDNRIFNGFVIVVIVFSALVIGARTYPVDARWVGLLGVLDNAVTAFFLVEILIRMGADKQGLPGFFRKGWNVFDFVIVAASLVPVDGSQMVLVGRLLRIFRVLRLVSMVPDLRILISALLKAIPRMGYVGLLMFIIFYIYGAFGSFMFERVNPVLWGDIGIAMLTLFRVATFEDWTDVMYETMEAYPLSWIYYVSFIFLAAFVFLNMMIGIVVDVMQREHQAADLEDLSGQVAQEAQNVQQEQNAQLDARLARIEERLDQLVRRE